MPNQFLPAAALLAIPVLASAAARSPASRPQVQSPVEKYETTAAGISVRVVRVNLVDPTVRVGAQVASGCPSSAESFDSLVARSKPELAVNGAYFSKDSLKPIGDIVVDGKLVTAGMMGTALAITADNRASIRRVTWGHAADWSGYQTVVGCGPALVLNGQIDVHPEEEGFHDPHVMGSTRRMGVGLLDERHMLIVTTLAPVSFGKWAQVMKALCCRDAMNLDAGASLAMYYRGQTLIHPGRKLTNLLIVKVDSTRSANSAAAGRTSESAR